MVRGYAVGEGGGELGLYTILDEECAVGEEGRELVLCAEGSLYELAEGGALALRVSLRISEGWTVEAVTPCPATEGMRVTVGSSPGEVRILLDGFPPNLGISEGDRSLLEIRLIRTLGDSPPGATLCKGEFYYMNPNSEICTRPVRLPEISTPNSDDIIFSEETTDKRDDMDLETSSAVTIGDDTQPPAESTAESDDMSDIDETAQQTTLPEEPVTTFPSVFMGCQETPVREGEYAVRFLFFGSTPVVCGEGGGVLEMEITQAFAVEEVVGKHTHRYEGDWAVCTFYGLRADRSYIFFIYTNEEVVSVCYRNGKYVF